MVIARAQGMATMIARYRVEPRDQARLVELLLRPEERFGARPGIEASALHRSLDGNRVIDYAQFRKGDGRQDPARPVEELTARAGALASGDAHAYEVVYQSTATPGSAVTIQASSPHATMINIFTVEPRDQDELINIWLQEGKQFERMPGFISATLHRSLDGRRVVNYAQFRKAEDWLEIARRASQLFGHFRAISQSDLHLYEVVDVQTPPS
jgi:heme-degrading monooxygenase HmoA